jgi:hypothetical protein
MRARFAVSHVAAISRGSATDSCVSSVLQQSDRSVDRGVESSDASALADLDNEGNGVLAIEALHMHAQFATLYDLSALGISPALQAGMPLQCKLAARSLHRTLTACRA